MKKNGRYTQNWNSKHLWEWGGVGASDDENDIELICGYPINA